LLGPVEFSRCLALQQRLVDELGQQPDGPIRLLICEHPDLITIGRGGSPGEVQMDSGLIRSRRVPVRWVNRGGGCLVHTAGQLAVYPILSLAWHNLSVGDCLARIQAGVAGALAALGISTQAAAGRYGLWGRTGQLAALGVAVRHWVSYHGAFVNVCPRMGLFRLVDSDPEHHSRMSCLVAERGRPVRMTSVRAELVRHLAESFGCDRYHLHTGHPWLSASRCPSS